MFDRIAPVYDVMNRVMTVGLDLRWRRLAAAAAVRPGDRVLDAACGTGDLAVADVRAGAASVTGVDFSPRMLERARRKAPGDRVGRGRPARAAVRGRRASTRRRSGSASGTSPTSRARCASSAACCGPAAGSRSSRSPSRAACCSRSSRSGSTGSCRCSGGCCPAGPRTPTCRPRSRGSRQPRSSPRSLERAGFERGALPAPRRLDHRPAHRDSGRMNNTLAAVDATPGLACLHGRARGAARTRPWAGGPASPRWSPSEALAAGGKRLRPLLCFLSDGERRPRAAARGRGRDRARPHGDARPRRPRRRRADAPGRPLRLVGLRPRGGAVGRRLPVRVRVRRAVGGGRLPRRRRSSPTPALRSRAARRCSARQTRRPGDDDRRLPRALRAQDREALRGRLPARLRRRPGARRVRPRARHRLPDRRRHPRLRRADPGDREDPRHRPARGHADDAAPARRAAGRGRAPRARRRAARRRARPRRRHRCARPLPRGGARVRCGGPCLHRLRAPPRGARGPHLRRGGSRAHDQLSPSTPRSS